jgi:hypothetical protein
VSDDKLPSPRGFSFSERLATSYSTSIVTPPDQSLSDVVSVVSLGQSVRQPYLHIMTYEDTSYFMGIKIFNHLPPNKKILSNRIELFKSALKKYLFRQPFYSLQEYFSYSS